MNEPISNVTLRVHVGDSIKEITHEQLADFADLTGLDAVAPNRYSWLLVVDMLINLEVNGIDPTQVVQEIKSLESSSHPSFVKPATQFKHPPLYPLWHKHYFSAHFVPHNIHAELNRGEKLENLVNEVLDPNKSPVITREMINELSHRVVHEPFEARSDEGRMTGEWLVFAKHDGNNYYLCMATHDAGDQVIYDKLAYAVKRQFPMLEPFASAQT